MSTPTEPPPEPTPGEGSQPPPPPGYGTPPPPPPGYGQQPPGYEQGYPATPGYPSAPGYPSPGMPASYTGAYANWGLRVVGSLVDFVGPVLLAEILYFAGARSLGSLLYLAALAWAIYNKVLEGNTGQSYGKKVAGTKTISYETGQLIGPGMSIGRFFLHILDAIPCYIGFLWPLWDAKRQTFADKIVKTVVVMA